MTITKILIPNKSWLVQEQNIKLGTLNRETKGFSFFRKGVKVELPSLTEVKSKFGVDIFKSERRESPQKPSAQLSIYDYPCQSTPYNAVYNVKKKLPIYAKSRKSKSLYCAGYYLIRFKNEWVKSLCPKLITLERYPYKGPFKTENEINIELNLVNL